MTIDTSAAVDDRAVLWLDIDNTLYSASAKISQAMGARIHAYFVTLGLEHDEASKLHHQYYTQYGLALRGLVRHHGVDPLDFDRKCDGSLPLEDMIDFDPKLRKLLDDVDKSKARIWALTNAFKPHAMRVLKILKIDDLVEDIVYCDYRIQNFVCKPEPEYYTMAMEKAKITDPSKCYFVDDNRSNVDAAISLGWGHCVHFCETGLESVEGGKLSQIDNERLPGAQHVMTDISSLEELRKIWPEVFVQPNNPS
ncbi:pyrimidine 5-nucleotidase [Coprinopsis marcescibilis]|uniref:Pyrimidine 5-nucleotidase n=1 Tax=Coprinopsis marcescibilis TaxID=230819 RepID=A0A5C3KS33_COPMA|nr:pyrimidine 5-nucleotidase [Coprinopsis marcescibilis]